ncbi:MAG: hypothetical protein IT581_08240 [Verrucomicrobiales bacterium]|nr:hypothetical protein [Verrucomicrobiales bacterium]
MKAIHGHYLFVLTLSLVVGGSAKAADSYLQCRVDGVTNLFPVMAQAVLTPKDGLEILSIAEGRTEVASLFLHLPTPKLGLSRSTSETNITLSFSRSMFSSSLADYYNAGHSVPGSELEIDLLKQGEIGEMVEGRFSGLAVNPLGKSVRITEGSFSVIRTQSMAEASSPKRAPSSVPSNSTIRHSYLTLGGKTAIIDEDGKVEWEYRPSSRDGFVLPNGHLLIAWNDKVEEVTRDKQVVLSYALSAANREISTTARLANGNTLVTELGPRPRLLEISAAGAVAREFPLLPETDNTHMQTRMARQLSSGNFLVPHLLAFAVKEYAPDGTVVSTIHTDLPELGGRASESWPFTAIRLGNGNTLVSLTHGNQVVEFARDGRVAWRLTNREAGGLLKDPCGVQRLANGNTVIGSHGATQGISIIEVTPELKIVWTSDHPHAAGVHHLQVLTTNGRPEPQPPLR